MASFQRQQPQMNMQHEVQRNTEIQRNLVEEEEDTIQRRNFDIQRNFMMPEENMVEENNPSVNRRMIPAPLLASVKGFTEGNFDSYFHPRWTKNLVKLQMNVMIPWMVFQLLYWLVEPSESKRKMTADSPRKL